MGVAKLLRDWQSFSGSYTLKKAGVRMVGGQVVRAASGVDADPMIVFSHSKNGRCMSIGCIGKPDGEWQPDISQE